jgi:hypothetical protein
MQIEMPKRAALWLLLIHGAACMVHDGPTSYADLGTTGAESTGSSTGKPNFVMFFADDFGWGDLPSYGHPTQEHGRIDDMAEQGIRFTQWYSSESLCTPSRAGSYIYICSNSSSKLVW